MPRCGSTAASTTTKPILTMPKAPFSTSTQVAPRSPVSTESWSVKTTQTATQMVNTAPAPTVASSA